jgi:hypothetical protein
MAAAMPVDRHGVIASTYGHPRKLSSLTSGNDSMESIRQAQSKFIGWGGRSAPRESAGEFRQSNQSGRA